MKELFFGTTNPAKLKQVRGALGPAGIEVKGFTGEEKLPLIVENKETAVGNARVKALGYAEALNKPIFAMDNALYLEGLSPEDQPGLKVRRIGGGIDRPSDEQMLDYYSRLIASLGERVKGYWEFGLCLATPEGKTWEATIKSPRIFTGKPSKAIVSGYPLESLQIDPEFEKYIAEMTQEEQDRFWQKAIGEPLLDFIESISL